MYDADGNLCAVANCPDTYKPVLAEGSGRTQVIRMVLIVSNTSAVQLKIDPAIVLATRGYVDDGFGKHLAALDPHPEYMTVPESLRPSFPARQTRQQRWQVMELSCPKSLRGELGEDEVKPMTPLRVAQAISSRLKQATESLLGLARFATQVEVESGVDDQIAISPKKLRWGFSLSKNQNGYVVLPSWLGGLIIQWGRIGPVNQGATAVINFPLGISELAGLTSAMPLHRAHFSRLSRQHCLAHAFLSHRCGRRRRHGLSLHFGSPLAIRRDKF